MKILLISYSNLSSDGRLVELRLCLKNVGELITINIDKNGKYSKKNIIDNIFSFQGNGIIQYIKFIFFCIKISNKYKPFDLIVADNRKGIIPTIICKLITNAKYSMYDAREMYIFKEAKTFISKVGCIVEKLFMNTFNIISCANKPRAIFMKKLYNLKKEPIVFENIRKLQYGDISEEECKEKFSYLFKDKKFIDIVSTSGEELIRCVDILVEAMSILGQKYRLFLIGCENKEGHKKIEKICKKNKWNNIVRYKWLSKSELKYVISHCDIGIVNYSFQNTNNKYCASGKLYEFIFEKIPIVTTTNPPLKYICKKYKIGICDDYFVDGIKMVINNYEFYKNNVINFAQSIDTKKYLFNVAQQIFNEINEMNNKKI